MKKSILLAASLLALNLTPVFSQPVFGQNNYTLQVTGPSPVEATNLTKFNLDFPGGTPQELVAAIEKATGKPLNAIIPDEDADVQIPPLKMNDVDVVRLFSALELASIKQVKVVTATFGFGNQENYSTFNSDYGFRTDAQPSDSSVWYFHADKPPTYPVVSPKKVCRFYQLDPYLNRGLTVDDITTAIQTGWKMMGETSPPEISFHKETKLLIAVGEPDKLEVIDNVLKALEKSNYKPSPDIDPITGMPAAKPDAEKSSGK